MTDPTELAGLWTSALAEPSEENVASLAAVLSDEVTTASPLGVTEGRAAVLETFGSSPLAAFLAEAEWVEPVVEGDQFRVGCTFSPRAPVGGLEIVITLAGGKITRVETSLKAAPPPTVTAVDLTGTIASAVNGALLNGTPVLVAYVDSEGRPHMSPRGTAQVFSADQLAVWIRNPGGGLLAAIPSNPNVALFYRDPATRTAYQFAGRARVVPDEATRDHVYNNSPQLERNLDAAKRGVAVIVDLDQVEGRGPSGPVAMARNAAGTSTEGAG